MSRGYFLDLSKNLAKSQFKLKNEGSYLGIFWYLLNPVLMFILLYLIFYPRLGQDILHYPAYLFIGISLYNFFQQSTQESTYILSSHASIIKSVKLPLEALVTSIVLKNAFSHLFEILFLCLIIAFTGIPLGYVLAYPLIFAFFAFFCLGVCFLLASINMYLADLSNIWNYLSTLIFFATPIFYSIGFQGKLMFANMANPLYFFITVSREAIIYQRFPGTSLVLGALGYSLLYLIFGLLVFRRLKPRFAEML